VEANPNLLSGNEGQGFGGRGGFGEETNNQKLLNFLEANESNPKYLVVAQNSQSVSSIIIQTGLPAISIGGFMGGDPTITLDQFIAKVKAGEFRYMLVGGMGRGGFGGPGNNGENEQPWQGGQGNGENQGGFGGWGGGPGGGDPNSDRAEILQWVKANGKLVDPALWQNQRPKRETADSSQAEPGTNAGSNNGFGAGRRGMGAQLYDLSS
jgi:4-amino-4-deoxy-L-arabinose transferase-like glycosyltransferase